MEWRGGRGHDLAGGIKDCAPTGERGEGVYTRKQMWNGDCRVAHAQVGVAGRRHGGGMRALVNAHPRAEKEGSEMANVPPVRLRDDSLALLMRKFDS